MTERTQRALTTRDLERMRLPYALWYVTLDKVADSVKQYVTNYLLNIQEMCSRPAGLLIMGEAGVGKTAIASLILQAARSWSYTALHIPVWEFRDAIRNRVQFDLETTLVERAKQVDVLCLDSLDKDDLKDTLYGYKYLGDIIAQRGANKKVTLLTTQLLAEDIRQIDGFWNKVKNCMVAFPVEGPDLNQESNESLQENIFKGSV